MALRGTTAVLVLAALLSGCGSAAPYRISGTGKQAVYQGYPGRSPEADERLAFREFLWPVSGIISSGFGYRFRGHHDGVDIIAPAGTEVRAADLGMTIYAGDGMRGYGNAVVLDHGDGVRTLYGHLDTIRVKSPDAVPAGAVIGTVGRTGNATGYHLHFELWVDGEAVDPLAYLPR